MHIRSKFNSLSSIAFSKHIWTIKMNYRSEIKTVLCKEQNEFSVHSVYLLRRRLQKTSANVSLQPICDCVKMGIIPFQPETGLSWKNQSAA